MFQLIKQLQHRGVMGLNRRNVHYIGKYNPRHLFPLVDDKMKTKSLALQAGVQVPELIGTVEYQHDARRIEQILSDHSEFVIKPTKGSGGKGILVIVGRDGEKFIRSNGTTVTLSEVRRHVSNILGGLFSLGGKRDIVMIEALIHFDPSLSQFSYEGVPDIRHIVFQGFPVMAMIRLATHDSHGKANLHQGAVGVGLDLATGKAGKGVRFDGSVDVHPDTKATLSDLEVPQWEQMMELSAKCYDMTKLGYLGADIVLDEKRGPLLLELNARPGLSIQIANASGLLKRLRYIEDGNVPQTLSAEERARFAIDVLSGL